jgi:hypothetical protein
MFLEGKFISRRERIFQVLQDLNLKLNGILKTTTVTFAPLSQIWLYHNFSSENAFNQSVFSIASAIAIAHSSQI